MEPVDSVPADPDEMYSKLVGVVAAKGNGSKYWPICEILRLKPFDVDI